MACLPVNKGMPSFLMAPHIFFYFPEARVDLPGLDRLQHNWIVVGAFVAVQYEHGGASSGIPRVGA